MTVWDTLVGQRRVVEALQQAVAGHGMTHAWLFTGPPGSGRSNAAIAFAAALQCETGGCGGCGDCRTTLAGSHPDVALKRTDKVIISVDEAREWVRQASLMPTRGRWQVIVVEDADRLHERANNALLKAIEEPGEKTIWMLCAPHPEDVLQTIRSRARHVSLATPTADEVAGFLTERLGIAEPLAAYAARASQGHIGRAKALATQEETRNRRREVVRLAPSLDDLGSCLKAATNLVEIAEQESATIAEGLELRERRDLEALYGDDRRSQAQRSARAAIKEMEDDQKRRRKRLVFDAIDRSLMDLLSFYRDVLALQTGAGGFLVNDVERPLVEDVARRTTPESNLRRIDAVYEAREQMMEFNTPPLLALESMMVALRV